MLRILVGLELAAASVLLALAAWPVSGHCTGFWMGLDCASRMIFAVNLFAPLGLLALIFVIWALVGRPARPKYPLLAGTLALLS